MAAPPTPPSTVCAPYVDTKLVSYNTRYYKPRLRKMTVGDLKKAVETWDFALGWECQRLDTVDIVAVLLFEEGARWQLEVDRRSDTAEFLELRVHHFLLLMGHETQQALHSLINRASRLTNITIACVDDEEVILAHRPAHLPHLTIPEWLTCARVSLRDQVDLDLDLEIRNRKRITAGDGISELINPEEMFGTVGTFMSSGSELYALTAGHVIEQPGMQILLRNEQSGVIANATHIPNITLDDMNKEVALLKVADGERDNIDNTIPNVDMNHYDRARPLVNATPEEINFKRERSRYRAVKRLAQGRGCPVYKKGITTGTTSSRYSLTLPGYPGMSHSYLST
jgi:hypothetical protein